MINSSIKCLYVHDHKFKKIIERVYSEGKITNEVFLRYILHKDELVVLSRIEEYSECIGLTEITLENIEFLPVRGLNFSRVFSIHLAYNIKHILRQVNNADFIVVRLPSFLGIFTLVINILFKKKYFIEMVGDVEESLISTCKDQDLLKSNVIYLYRDVNKYFIKKADGVIYVTKKYLQEKYPTKGIMANASNVEVVVRDIVVSKADYEIKQENIKIGLIASFNNHYKGITEAISAINILNTGEQKIVLHILGSGRLKEHYKVLARSLGVEDYIFFDGVLKGGQEVSNWLSSLDLYIQPSYTEGLPRALIEAMSVGLPAVATNVGGIPELLPRAALIQPHDSEALAEKIKCFIDSQSLRFEHGKLNYEKSKEYDKEVLKQRRSQFWKAAREIVKRSAA